MTASAIGVVYVALGGGLGAALRYGCGLAASRWIAEPALWSTLFVNVVGSLAMGLVFGAWGGRFSAEGSNGAILFLAVGLLGGFTTYSSYALETVRLLQQGRTVEAGAFAFGTMIMCFAVFTAGVFVTRGAT
ncbi:MAG: CrcB family protein [Pseudomonadota bacterium]